MEHDPAVIRIDNLHFGYTHHQLILDRLQLRVPRGAIYGFLGANGAGKSTTIRSILGLLRPHRGEISLFGQPVRSHRLEVLRKVGSLIEAPSIYKHLSGYDNLRILARYLDIPNRRIEEVLELVRLSAHGKKKAGKYSTGMKQRLGMAMALLADPELLILDEPTNGLDPNGMIEFRNLLQELHAGGKTIFLSSHLLGEIEKIVTHVGILKQGTLLFEGTVQELEAIRGNTYRVRLETSDNEGATTLLRERTPVRALPGSGLEMELERREDLPGLIELLVGKGIQIHELHPVKSDLEQLFINLTQEQ